MVEMSRFPITAFVQDRASAGISKFHPAYFERIFESNAAGCALSVVDTESIESTPPDIHVINLGSQYRLSESLVKLKGGGICVYDGLDFDCWRAIRSKGGKLILDMMIESFFATEETVTGLYEEAGKRNVDLADVILINSNLQSTTAFEKVRQRLELPAGPRVAAFNACYWLIKGHNRKGDIEARFVKAQRARSRERTRKFVSFNGRLRPHRLFVVLCMLARGYLDEAYVSLLGYSTSTKPEIETVIRQIRGFHEAESVHKFIPSVLERLPLQLDVDIDISHTKAGYIKSLPWISQKPDFYDDSYFSVIVDTTFWAPAETLFLTPIAFKSFMNFSPFVYFGNAGALAEFRRLGFQTFSPFINENYDKIENTADRMAACFATLDQLMAYSRQELSDIHDALWPRLEYNFRHFYRTCPNEFLREFEQSVFGTAET